MTEQETKFLNRVAKKMALGMDLEAAGRAVLADDRRIYATYKAMRSYERDAFEAKMARQTFAMIHARSALEQAA